MSSEEAIARWRAAWLEYERCRLRVVLLDYAYVRAAKENAPAAGSRPRGRLVPP